jgi:hypothetical protein
MVINVGSKTLNMVGGGGINSPTHQTSHYQGFLRMGAPDSPVRHQCANGRLQRLILTSSFWADGTPDSEQFLSGAHGQSGVAAKIQLHNSLLSGFSRGRGSAPGPDWPTVRERTGQSSAPKTETLTSFSFCFSNPFLF